MSMAAILTWLELERREREERKHRDLARQHDRARWKAYLLEKRRRAIERRHHQAPHEACPPGEME